MKRGRPGTPGFVGQRLRSAREARGLSALTLSELLGVSRQAIAQYETGTQTPRPDITERLSAILNLGTAFFLRPTLYDDNAPLFFRKFASATRAARTRAAERHRWLAELTSYVEEFVQLPPVEMPAVPEVNWIGLDAGQIEDLAMSVRRSWGLSDGAISNMTLLLENHGVIISNTSLSSDALDAFSGWLDGRPFIVQEGVAASAARTRMNLAHELGHLVMHRGVTKNLLSNKETLDQIEAQAWRFASAFLLPANAFRADVSWSTLEVFRLLKPKWKVSIQAMVKRARDIGMITPEAEQAMWRSLARRGWRITEPLDSEIAPEEPSILHDALTLMVRSRVITPQQILDDTAFAESDVRDLAGLDLDFFAPPTQRVRLLPLPASSTEAIDVRGGGSDVIPFPQQQTISRPRESQSAYSVRDKPRTGKEVDKMAKSDRNSGKPWTSTEVKQLRELAKENTPTRVIGLKLGRTEDAVRTKASEEDVSLKPTNQSPYNRSK